MPFSNRNVSNQYIPQFSYPSQQPFLKAVSDTHWRFSSSITNYFNPSFCSSKGSCFGLLFLWYLGEFNSGLPIVSEWEELTKVMQHGEVLTPFQSWLLSYINFYQTTWQDQRHAEAFKEASNSIFMDASGFCYLPNLCTVKLKVECIVGHYSLSYKNINDSVWQFITPALKLFSQDPNGLMAIYVRGDQGAYGHIMGFTQGKDNSFYFFDAGSVYANVATLAKLFSLLSNAILQTLQHRHLESLALDRITVLAPPIAPLPLPVPGVNKPQLLESRLFPSLSIPCPTNATHKPT